MKEKIGIIDVGGGLRDIYGAGVLDYLLDNKIYLPYCIGVSAGSANVASYIAKQKGRNKVYYKEYAFRKEYISFNNYKTKGSYVDLDYVYRTLSNEGGEYPLDYDQIMKNNSEMVVVASNAETGEPEYFYKKDLIKNDYGVFAASCCIPIACKEYNWQGKKYFDGGITDPIPIKKAYENGCTKVIVILTRPIDYRKSDGNRKLLYGKLKRKYPEFTKKLVNRCELYNSTLENLLKNDVKKGNVLIIAPDDDLHMKTLEKDKEKLETLYQKGYKDGEKIKKFL
ncbi:MAG: patatin family protein [Bacilli bacterium]